MTTSRFKHQDTKNKILEEDSFMTENSEFAQKPKILSKHIHYESKSSVCSESNETNQPAKISDPFGISLKEIA